MFDHCLYFNTAALARQLDRRWAAAYRPFGLTAAQGFLLRAVLRQPGLRQSELARLLVISRPTATRALDGLAAKNLIDRQPTGRDGREVAIFPSATAEALQAPLEAASVAVSAQLKATLGEADFGAAVDRVRRIRQAIE